MFASFECLKNRFDAIKSSNNLKDLETFLNDCMLAYYQYPDKSIRSEILDFIKEVSDLIKSNL